MNRCLQAVVLIVCVAVVSRSAEPSDAIPDSLGEMSAVQLADGLVQQLAAKEANADIVYLHGLALLARARDNGRVVMDKPLPFSVVDALGSSLDWRLRRLAAKLLGAVDIEGDATPAYTRLLQDKHWRVRHAAIAALHAVPGEWTTLQVDAILGRKTASFAFERVEAVKVAGELSLVDVLVKGCYDPDSEVQLYSVWGLDRWIEIESPTPGRMSPPMRSAIRHVAQRPQASHAREVARELLSRPGPDPKRKEKERFKGEGKR